MSSYLYTRDLYTEWQDLVTRVDDDEETEPLDEEETERCKILGDLFGEIGESAGIHGGTLIPEDEFASYAEDFAGDVNGVDMRAWPFNHVDWEAAGNALKSDYHEVEFDGTTYLFRD
jgi:hypothetical protein